MSKMGNELERLLDENKYEAYWSLKELIEKYWKNQTTNLHDGFISCITPDGIPEYWVKARRVLNRIENNKGGE